MRTLGAKSRGSIVPRDHRLVTPDGQWVQIGTPEFLAVLGDVDPDYDPFLFAVKNLDEFAVSDKGVTFLYDARFPHVIRALQPTGEYFFSYAELQPRIKRNGPLGILLLRNDA